MKRTLDAYVRQDPRILRGRELDGGRLARTRNLLTELKQEVEKDRPDYSITERDLWVTPPPE